MDEIVDAANRDKFESDMNDYIVAQTTGEIGNITFNQYNRQKEAKQEQKMQARGNTLDAQVMADIEAGIQEDIANIDKDFNKTIESEIRQFNTGMQQGTDIQSVSVKNDMSEQGGKVMGQKSLDEVELLYSQMTTTERAQYEEAITELGRACDELHALGGVHSACGD